MHESQVYPDIHSAVSAGVAFDRHNRMVPDEEVHQLYEKMLVLHDELYKSLASSNIYETVRDLRKLLDSNN